MSDGAAPRFATLSHRYADGRAGRICYRDSNDQSAPAVVFIHGINMASAIWDPVADRLPGRRRIAFDLRGHGGSQMRGPFEIEDYLADLWTVIAAADVSEVQLVGISLGGLVACLAAQTKPELVSSVVAFGSAMSGVHPDLDGGMRRLRQSGVAEYFQASLSRNTLPAGVAVEVQQTALALAVAGNRDVAVVEAVTRAGFRTNMAGRLHPSGRPTLVVTGSLDTTCPPRAGSELAEATGGRAEMIPGRGHVLPLEVPELCVSFISRPAQPGHPRGAGTPDGRDLGSDGQS